VPHGKEKTNLNNSTFLIRNHGGQKKVSQVFKYQKEEMSTLILHPVKIAFRNKGQSVTRRPALKEWAKESS
jgi:hypothetical protein